MTSSLDDIPEPLLGSIISYFDDPKSIGAFSCLGSRYSDVVAETRCWELLYRKRWKQSSIEEPSSWNIEFRRRFQLDKTIQGCIDTLMVETSERQLIVRSVAQCMKYCKDSTDLAFQNYSDCRKNQKEEGTQEKSSREEMIKLCLLRSIHCSIVFEDILDLANKDASPESVEDYAIVSSKMFFEVKNGPEEDTSAWIRQELEKIATMVRQRYPRARAEDLDAEEKLNLLIHVFFEELGFTGNTQDYYQLENSMLHKALERRTGIPMTLAILFQCVSHRIGLKVDIIGLPGHIVIGVPTLDRYVDVFRKGRRLLTAFDCERIVNSYGHQLIPEYMIPLSPAGVFRRILANCGNCLAQTFPPNASKRMAIEAMRAVLINPTMEQVEDCRRWFSQILWGQHSSSILQEMSSW